jgi:protein ImuB
VSTASRRDHEMPVRYLDGDHAVEILVATGPDRINGGSWEAAPYIRDYFHCVTADGRLILLFQTADRWYLHGWWD